LTLPVTLHVNRESRAITLEHYTIICHYLDERPAVITLPICLDLKRDLFSISIQSIANSNFNHGQCLGLPCSVIQEIRTLKLISAWQNFPFRDNLRPPHPVFYDHTMTVPTVEQKALFFKGFSGLEEVHLVPGPKLFETRQVKNSLGAWWGGVPWSPVEEIITVEDQEEAIKTMKAYFKGVKRQTEDFNLPKIIVVEK
jgi:hypothetical protein